MIVTRRFPLKLLLIWGLYFASIVAVWAAVVFAVYVLFDLHFLRIPFLPIASVGTAVAFYIGFKNNSSYDRFWEGRKIWGGIVNESRTWAAGLAAYVDPGSESEQTQQTRRELVYRHLAWVNALRLQLRRTSRFHDKPTRTTKRRLEAHGDHMRNDWDTELEPFLDSIELKATSAMANPATHLLVRQSRELAKLVEDERLDMFRQLELMNVIRELYTLQGKCERIKNTPFPRQYAEYSRLFVRVFTFLLPFGMLDVFAKKLDGDVSLTTLLIQGALMVLSTSLVGWVFNTMEGIGDSSEDPFERSMNDVPMNALSRTIEIDLRQIVGDTEIPPKEKPIGNVLY